MKLMKKNNLLATLMFVIVFSSCGVKEMPNSKIETIISGEVNKQKSSKTWIADVWKNYGYYGDNLKINSIKIKRAEMKKDKFIFWSFIEQRILFQVDATIDAYKHGEYTYNFWQGKYTGLKNIQFDGLLLLRYYNNANDWINHDEIIWNPVISPYERFE